MRSRFRAIFLFLAACAAAATLRPDVALLAVQDLVVQMRAPASAEPIARALFAAGAVVFGLVFVAWTRVRSLAVRALCALVASPPRAFWLWTVGLTLAVRFLIAATISYEPVADARWYHDAAAALAGGHGLAVDGTLTAYRPPGYPFLLSLTYAWFGPEVALAWVWGLLATAIIVGAIHFIARKLYDAATARIAAFSAAIYPALALMTGQAMSDLPFVALLLSLVAFVLAGRPFAPVSSLAVGVVVGLLTLTRGVALGMSAVVPLIWLLRQRTPWRFAASTGLIVVAFGVSVAPWALRNQVVFGQLTLGTNLGTNAYVGNHRGAGGGPVPATWPSVLEHPGLNEAQVDRELMRAAIDFVETNPGAAIAILPGKLRHLYLLETGVATALFQGERPSAAWLKYALYGICQVAYACLLAVFLVRALDLFTPIRRPRGAQWTGWLLIGYVTLLCLIFHGEDRYRLPILPWMLIEGGVLLARITYNSGGRCPATANGEPSAVP